MSTKDKVGKVIEKAIKENDIATLKILKDALDEVHDTGNSVEIKKPKLTITPDNLPPDEDYESICKILEIPLTIAPSIKNARISILPDLWMGSFPKPDTIQRCKNGVMIPKFDGCSAGLKFIRDGDGKIILQLAQTRGIKANITSKMSLITNELKRALNKYQPFKDIEDFVMCIRGEVVLKDSSTTSSAPASYVAGKINGYDEVFAQAVNDIEFVPYEIMRFVKHGKLERLTQEECFKLLYDLNQLKFKPINMMSYTLEEVKNAFDMFSRDLKEPLDGVVYCSNQWTYPITESETMPATYGKWAWKPSKEAISYVNGFEYSISRDGKIEIMMLYDGVIINGSTYTRAKISVSRLTALEGIGIGSQITVRLANGISPFITEFIPEPNVKPYTLPTKCPFCKSKLKLTKGANTTLKCLNVNCPEIKIQKYKNFLKVMGIKGIAEKTLNKLDDLSFDSIIKNYLNMEEFKDMIMGSSIQLVFQALGFGGQLTTLKKLKDTPLDGKGSMTISSCYANVVYVLETMIGDDEFLDDFVDTLKRMG